MAIKEKMSKNPKKINIFELTNLAIIIVNFIPVFNMLFFDWGIFLVVAAYWSEIIVVELITFVKIIFLAFCFPKKGLRLFFNGFILAQMFSGMAFMFFIPFMALFSALPGGNGWTGLALLSEHMNDLVFFASILFIRYAISFFVNFVGKGEYREFEELDVNTPRFGGKLIGNLLTRLILMQFVIGLGLFIVAFTRAPVYFGAFFVFIKTEIELKKHDVEHTKVIGQETRMDAHIRIRAIASIVIVTLLGVIVLSPFLLSVVSIGESHSYHKITIDSDKEFSIHAGESIDLNSFDKTRGLLLEPGEMSYDPQANMCYVTFALIDEKNSCSWGISQRFYPYPERIADSTINYFSPDIIYVKEVDCVNNTAIMQITKIST